MTKDDWKKYEEICLQFELEFLEWLINHNRYKNIKHYIKKYKK